MPGSSSSRPDDGQGVSPTAAEVAQLYTVWPLTTPTHFGSSCKRHWNTKTAFEIISKVPPRHL